MAEPAQRVRDSIALGATQTLGSTEEVALWKERTTCDTGVVAGWGKSNRRAGTLKANATPETRASGPVSGLQGKTKEDFESLAAGQFKSQQPSLLGLSSACRVMTSRPQEQELRG